MSFPSLSNCQKNRTGDLCFALILMLGSAAALVAVGYDLLVRAPFAWHLRQPATVQGGLEAVLLLGLFALVALRGRRWTYILGAVAGLAYLRRHNAELSILPGILYVEFLLGFGLLVFRRLGEKDNDADTQIKAFLLGLACWLLLSLLLSMVYMASPPVLAALLFAGGVVALVVNRQMPTSLRIFHNLASRPAAERIAGALLLAWFLILAARSGNVFGHDAIWYLGQGDRFLAPNGSIFESLGFVSPVHYFPKLWEVLLLPLTIGGEIRFQSSLTIAVLGLFMLMLWQLAGKLGVGSVWRWWLIWPLATLPALANSALSLKTDLICACLMVIMCIQLVNWLRARRGDWLFYALAAAALACSSKLTAIPYVGVAVLFTLVMAGYRFAKASGLPPPGSSETLSATAFLTFVVAVVVALLLLARTWLLAGVPTIGPDPLMVIWNFFGWEMKEPVGTLNWTRPQDWSEVPRLIYEWLLAPSYMSSIRISWVGNFWAVLALFALILGCFGQHGEKLRVTPGASGLLLLLALTGLMLAVAYKYHSRGSDGNYFIFAISLAACLGIRAVTVRLEQLPWTALSLVAVIALTGVFHGAYSFISASWSPPGTRTLDWNFSRLPMPPEPWRDRHLTYHGLGDINAYLKTYPRSERVIADGFKQDVLHLPVRVEMLDSIRYSRPEYMEDSSSLLEFMQRFEMNHLLLAPVTDKSPTRDRLLRLHEAMAAAGWWVKQDRGGVLYSRPEAAPDTMVE